MTSFQLANESSPLSLSPEFILPEDKRPNLSEVPTLSSIPIIDLSPKSDDNNDHSHTQLVHKISQACEEYGFFQIVNHGVPDEICKKMMAAITHFFDLPPQQRAIFSTKDDDDKPAKIFTYKLKVQNGVKVNMWSECFFHHWNPTESLIHPLPEEVGTQYREAFPEYAREIDGLINRVMSLISEGLGLEKDCLKKMMGDEKAKLKAQANFYPPSPNPELTLGLHAHTDFNTLTILHQSQGVSSLQVLKDGKWVAVPPIPNAFVVNLGDQIEVVSNGRYKSVFHRAVSNKTQTRVSFAVFYEPNEESIIGPIEDLIDEQHPPKFRKYRYSEFRQEFFKQLDTENMVKEVFKA